MTAKVPKPIRNVDIMSLPLSTKEGFVLSRVDGSSSVEDISMMSGVPQAQLATILDRLAELGAVILPWKAPVTPAKPVPAAGKPAAAAPAATAPAAARPLVPLGPAARYDAKLLDEPVDISREIRKRILDYYFTLETHNYYQILGVSVRADKKDIRSAYFELSKFFHPDSQFTKNLGSYKAKMEAVFKRLTEAYEVLGKAKRRAEYDEYIAVAVQTERVSQTLDEGARRAQTLRNIEINQPKAAANVAAQPAAPVITTRPAMPPPASPVNTTSTRREQSLRPPASREDRKAAARDRLKRGLAADGKSTPPPAMSPSSRPPPSGTPEERRVSVIKDLARSLRVPEPSPLPARGQNLGVQQHLDAARASERAGDWLGAANSLQLALALEPDRAFIISEYTRVSAAVARNLAANYEKQARYEEKSGKWDAAARSWTRVCDGRPEDATAARHATEALLKSGGDLHRAQRYAQRVVELEPNRLENLTLLARVYLAAGLKLNARRELEKAVKLDPRDEMVKNLLNEAR